MELDAAGIKQSMRHLQVNRKKEVDQSGSEADTRTRGSGGSKWIDLLG
jgi:hypothetical protein